ncbi:MAG: VanW family protein [Agathobacter sp.]|uniref:VanW family protein n=1 Tax=Agathobacter sp. TaxID=2021311 RepID=UPI00258C71D7|nr:VanW family protein [Agathobacter sp.]MCR5677566.1 VanW family protein [Agathobacter sp.]
MKKKLFGLLATAVAAMTLLVNPSRTQAETAEEETRIVDGIYIGTVYVGGMTKDEANNAISDYVQNLMSTTFTLKGVDDSSVEATAEQMGIRADAGDSVDAALGVTHSGNLITRYKDSVDLKTEQRVLPLSLEVDKQETARFIYKAHDKLSKAAVNASLKKKGDTFEYIPGTDGEEVVEVDSVYAINEFLAKEYDGKKTEINLVTQTVASRGTREELAVVKDRLGSFTTVYGNNSGSSREQNVENACDFINGTIVYPGEEYRTHENLEPITEENGYAMGGTYLNGAIVDSVGGGICQVSTTLYNALIRAEIEITQRFNHSMTVTYVDPAADAAMAGDYKDLRFTNDTGYPIYIEGYYDGTNITFNIYGVETRAADREVSFESVITKQDDPSFQAKADASQEFGYYNIDQYAHIGMTAQLWKVVKEGGKEVSREIFNTSTYRSSPKIVTIGTGGATPEQLALINAAIATNDEEQVLAAYQKAVDLGKKAEEPADDKKPDKKKPDNKKPENKKPDQKKPDNTTPENQNSNTESNQTTNDTTNPTNQ